MTREFFRIGLDIFQIFRRVLPDAGTYYIRVTPVDSNGAAQIYDLVGSITIDEVMAGCVGDINGDGITDTADLGILISEFGTFPAPGAGSDLNGDSMVDTADLGILIGAFGGCTPI